MLYLQLLQLKYYYLLTTIQGAKHFICISSSSFSLSFFSFCFYFFSFWFVIAFSLLLKDMQACMQSKLLILWLIIRHWFVFVIPCNFLKLIYAWTSQSVDKYLFSMYFRGERTSIMYGKLAAGLISKRASSIFGKP